ncbi:MAG: HAMP domain-containing protein [Stomatobaculum sp.]|nr:HAMP domain-containing protein [Stomatobaculum sp.]
MNTFGLERFYRNHKIKEIEAAYEVLNEIVMEEGADSSRLLSVLEEYSDAHNISIAVIDSANSQSLQSTERSGDFLYQRIQKYLFNQEFRDKSKVLLEKKNYTIMMTEEEKYGAGAIDCFAFCGDNQTMLLMSTPVANMQESVHLANRFLSFAGVCVMIVGFLLVFFMTKQITEPIRHLAAISEKMGGLDFSERYEGQREDEIGVLGTNMNFMAAKLEETFRELKEKNLQLKHANGLLKEANFQLQEDIRRKEEIDEMRKAFIANVSHELKTPIALIQGYAEGLNDGLCEDPESRRYYLDVIIDESNRMNSLVKQLLTLSKLESGTPDLNLETFDLAQAAANLIGNMKVMAEEQGASINFRVKSADGEDVSEGSETDGGTGTGIPVMVRGDEFKIEEVLSNYLSNAAHHVNKGGSIVVTSEDLGSTVRTHVFNTGSSIPEEDIDHIWDKFYKVDKAHTRTYGGTGIGLSIVKAVMEAHGMGYGVRNVPPEEAALYGAAVDNADGAVNTDDADNTGGVDFWFDLPKGEESA